MAHSDILSQPDRGLGLDRPQTEALLALFSDVAPAPAPEPLEGERLEAVRLAAHEAIREVLDRHGVAE